MISYVAKVIHVIATAIYKVLLIASFTGELIISAGLWAYSILNNITENLISFFHIVYEDNTCIFTELPKSAKDAADSTLNQFLQVYSGFEEISLIIYSKANSLVVSFVSLINAAFVIVSEVFILLRNTVIFTGETTWLLITFIPVHLPQLLKSGITFIAIVITNTIVDAYMRLLNVTNYLTEVPFKSFLGITSAVVLIRLCVYFKETILSNIHGFYCSLVRNSRYLYHACYNYWINPDVRVITRMVNGNLIDTREVPFDEVDADDANTSADALCVICQERQKCVLTLPCRHICLCTECCRRLYSYQRTCPICRTFIYHSVTVYW